MTVDPSSLLLRGLTAEDKDYLNSEVYRLVFKGEVDWHSPYLNDWCKVACKDETQKLLMVSTVYPIRVLYSIINC